jgi:hypothetical protein
MTNSWERAFKRVPRSCVIATERHAHFQITLWTSPSNVAGGIAAPFLISCNFEK